MTFGLPMSSITTTRRPSLRLSTFELRWSVIAKRRSPFAVGRSEKRTGPKKNGDGGRVNAEASSILLNTEVENIISNVYLVMEWGGHGLTCLLKV